MMTIGFDAKRAVQNFTGLGNYSRYVIDALKTCYPAEAYRLYAPKQCENVRLEKILAAGQGSATLHYPQSAMGRCFSALWRIHGICRDLEADCVQLFHGLSNELPLNIHRYPSVRSVVTIHDLIFKPHPECYPAIDRQIYDFKSRSACQKADRIIAVSECTKRDIVRYYNINPDKIEVIYQGCDPSFAEEVSPQKLVEVRHRLTLPEHYLLSVGSIEQRKNTLLALRALRYLPQHLHLVLVGKHTSYTDELTAFARKEGLTKRLHIYHGLSFADLPAVYQAADCFVYPSKYEGFGIPILEALNSRIPVVAATGSCLEEAGGPQSLYVAPTDDRALAEAVLAAQDTVRRAEMIGAGLQWAERFSLRQMADETMTLYRKLIQK